MVFSIFRHKFRWQDATVSLAKLLGGCVSTMQLEKSDKFDRGLRIPFQIGVLLKRRNLSNYSYQPPCEKAIHRHYTNLAKAVSGVLICVVVLASCASKPSHTMKVWPTDDDGRTPGQGRAIVVLSIQREDESALLFREQLTNYTFTRDTPLTKIEDGTPVEKRWFYGYGSKVMAVEPGHYYLSRIETGHVEHRGGWDAKTNKPRVFDFTVAPGEVVYLGHVVTRWPDGRPGEYLMLRVENRASDARRMIENEFGSRGKEIADRMETRLVTVPKAIW